MALKKCVLIGGAPLTGKSTLAKKIAEQENGVLMSTDAIRDWLQSVVEKERHSGLFFSSELSMEQLHKKYPTPQGLLEAQLAQNHEVEAAIIGLLRTRYLEWDTLVLEGIVLSPGFWDQLRKAVPAIEFQIHILCHRSEAGLIKRLQNRGVWGEQKSSSEFLEKEKTWIILYDKLFKLQAEEYNLTTL